MSDTSAATDDNTPIPTLPDDAPIEIELDMEPTWLIQDRREILEAPSIAALEVTVAAIRARGYSDERKAQLRPYITQRSTWLKQQAAQGPASRPVTPAHGVAVVAAAATVVATPTPVEVSAPATILAEGSANVAPTLSPSAPVASVASPAPEGRPMVAGWRQILTPGPHQGQWGVAVEHLQHGVAIIPPQVGDVVIVNRRSGGSSQLKRITALVRIDTNRGVSICAVSDPAPGARATIARPRTAQQPAPMAPVPMSAPSVLESHATVVDSLLAVAAEGTSNAGVADLGAQSSSNASASEGRRLGVGFSTPEQYLEALRRGGLQPHTRVEYLAIVRQHGLTFDESTLPPANSNDLPVGQGITHTPTGPDVFSMTPAQRVAHEQRLRQARVGKSDAQLNGAALMRRGDIIAGAVAAGAGIMVAWEGWGTVERSKLIGELAKLGRADDAPTTRDAQVQLSRAVQTLHGSQYDVNAVRGDDVPDGIAARYTVIDRHSMPDGQEVVAVNGRASATVEVVLTVDLLEDGTVRYYGEQTLADRVRADYTARTAGQSLTSADITAWLQGLLTTRHGATAYGKHWYVPGGQRESAIALTRAVKAAGWGRKWIHGITLTTEAALIEGLAESFLDEIADVERRWTLAREEAQKAYNTVDPRTGKRARQTDDLTARGAASFLRSLATVSERVKGYSVLLGDAALTQHRERIGKLEAEIRSRCDDTSARGAMLEFS